MDNLGVYLIDLFRVKTQINRQNFNEKLHDLANPFNQAKWFNSIVLTQAYGISRLLEWISVFGSPWRPIKYDNRDPQTTWNLSGPLIENVIFSKCKNNITSFSHCAALGGMSDFQWGKICQRSCQRRYKCYDFELTFGRTCFFICYTKYSNQRTRLYSCSKNFRQHIKISTPVSC